MTEQLEFGQCVPRTGHEAEFLEFKATPVGGQVCNRFLRIAWGFWKRGQKVGAKAIVERIRWSMMVRRSEEEKSGVLQKATKGTKQETKFLINNNLTAYLARWAMESEPELKGFFETRETGIVPTARQMVRSLHGQIAAAASAALQKVG